LFTEAFEVMKYTSKHSTIIDIAQKLGISPSTVSRALRNHSVVKKETRELIKKVAEELRYIPNPIAQSLKSNKTTTIGVIVPEIKHEFFSFAISGIEEVAYTSGYSIIVCQSNESYEREVLNSNLLMQHRVAGVVVSISQNTKNGQHFQELLRRKIPLVFFDRVCDDIHASKVVIDDYQSAYDAVTYLISRGYKKIAHFAGPKGVGIYEMRMNGYVDAIKEHQIPFHEGFILHAGLDANNGYDAMDSLIKSHMIPDAIFTVNDPVALGACKRVKEAGLKIPEDVAAIGFSNNIIGSVFDPLLTTIDQFPFEMGKKATEILIETIEGTTIEPRTIVMKTKLIVREST
jgi:DNA-binding LacI/PurR family transcriptional regulator